MTKYARASKSEPALEAEYGLLGFSGNSSVASSGAATLPYTSSVETWRKRAVPCLLAASSSVNVPCRLVRITGSGERMLRSTCDSAAKCTMASGFSSVRSESTSPRVADIALHEPVARVSIHRRQVLEIARIGQLVQIDHAPIGLADHHADKRRPDEPRPARNQNSS